jgi:hypothetical protein
MKMGVTNNSCLYEANCFNSYVKLMKSNKQTIDNYDIKDKWELEFKTSSLILSAVIAQLGER